MEPSRLLDSDVNMMGLDTQNDIDVLSFAMDSFIDALIDDTSRWHKFAHFINNRSNFYDKYNSIAMELF
jgi:hypothetical protein